MLLIYRQPAAARGTESRRWSARSSFIASSSIAAAVSRALLDVFNRWQCSSIRFQWVLTDLDRAHSPLPQPSALRRKP
jgi:hypothetical protein